MHLPNTLVALLMAAPMILATSPASSSATPPIDNVPFKLDQGYKTAGYVTFCGRNTFTEIAGPIYQKNANGIPSTLQVYASSDDASSKMQCNDADSKNTAYGNPNPVVCCISVPESCAAKSSVAQSLDKSILIEANIDCQVPGAKPSVEEKEGYTPSNDNESEKKDDGYSGNEEDDGYSGNEEEKKDDGYSGNEEEEKDDGYSGKEEEEKDDGYSGNEEEEKDDGYSGNEEEEKDDGYSGNEEEKKDDGYSGKEEEKKDDGYSGKEEEKKDDGYSGKEEEKKDNGY